MQLNNREDLFPALLEAWNNPCPLEKCALLANLSPDVIGAQQLGVLCRALLGAAQITPGHPEKPALISPRDVPRRGLGSEEGRAAMIHAIAHIEFNAINLALDATLRFDGMPAQYYADWISVAMDEARHFCMLNERLKQLGHEYGDFPAHNGLWEAAIKTADDVLLRMALVPRVLEARGLDVTPQMIVRLKSVGDAQSAEILEIILQEEVRHVAIGTHWYRYLCDERGQDSVATFKNLILEHGVRLQMPLNQKARAEAGFVAAELD